tara:strand:+ start:167 stop:571 length:405 start_codon:yes stop_codon:yes gene_type:complete
MGNNVMGKIARLSKESNLELKSEKVELTIIDDLKKYTKGFSKYYSEGQGLQKKGERIKAELSDIISALYKWEELGDSIADDMASDLTKYEKAAKELGIKPSESKDYSEAMKAFKSYAESAKGFNRVAQNLIKIR